MKKLLLLIALTTPFISFSQESLDVITLNNGSVIVGKITEFNFNQNLTVQTEDGYGFMFKTQDIKNIKKKPKDTRLNRGFSNNFEHSNTLPHQNLSNPNQTQNYIGALPNSFKNDPYRSQNNLQNKVPNSGVTNQYVNPQYSNASANTNNGRPAAGYQISGQSQNYPNPQSPDQYKRLAPTSANNYQANAAPENNNYFSSGQKTAGIQPFANSVSANQPVKRISNPEIFTNIDTYGKTRNLPSKIDCMQGFGDFCFVNNTNKNIIVSLQKKQKDDFYADYKEIAIKSNAKGYFNSVKVDDYPFVVKVKNSTNSNQSDYIILGRGSIRVQKCKTEYININ